MKRTRIAIGSVTYAEKGKRALAGAGFSARVVRLDPRETKNGCAFALELHTAADTQRLRQLLQAAHVRYTEILEDELPML